MSRAYLRKFAFAYCGVCLLAAPSGPAAIGMSLPALAVAYGLAKGRRWSLYALYVHALALFAAGVLIAKPFSIAMAVFALGFALSHARRPPQKSASTFAPTRLSLRIRVGNTLAHTAEINENAVIVWMDPTALPLKTKVQAEIMGGAGRVVRFAAWVRRSHEPQSVKLELADPSAQLRTALADLVAANRRNGRVQMQLPALIEHAAGLTDAVTYDVSISGCYVACSDAALGIGEKISVTLSLDKDEPLTIDAEVVWRRESPAHGKPAGVAMKFIDVSREVEQRILSRLVRKDGKAA